MRPLAELDVLLKRVVRDGGTVRVHFGPKRRLPSRLLAGTLFAS